jgi:hypothetical protein
MTLMEYVCEYVCVELFLNSPKYVFMASCFVKHRDFIFYFYILKTVRCAVSEGLMTFDFGFV